MKASRCTDLLRACRMRPLHAQQSADSQSRMTARHCARLRTQISRRALSTAEPAKPPRGDAASNGPPEKSYSHGAVGRAKFQSGNFQYPRSTGNSGPGPQAMSLPKFRERYAHVTVDSQENEVVTLRGRVEHKRVVGSKLFFLSLTAEHESLQAMCNFGKLGSDLPLRQFKDTAQLLQRGDLVSITGRAVRTPVGELTIEAASRPELLAPALVSIPEKLKDQETRVQSRHLDLLVNRSSADVLRLRSYIIKFVRDYLWGKGFVEVQTPILAENAGGAVARPFTTKATATDLATKELAMRIAPELWLKRLVVGGFDKVFELGQAFRNEGMDTTHNPEFTMCEFYEAYASLPDLISQTEDLVSSLASHCRDLREFKSMTLPPVKEEFTRGPFKQLEFIPALEAELGFALPDLSKETAFADVQSLLASRQLSAEAPSLPKLLDRLAGTYLEPHSAREPLFITHHPACMSPLAKSFRCPSTGQAVSARAELFAAGRELANMYEEENSPAEQRRKFGAQAALREDEDGGGGSGVVVDESYLDALAAGLPPTGGWGCGVDRLVMLFGGAERIGDCLTFGSLRNVVGLTSGAGRKAQEG